MMMPAAIDLALRALVLLSVACITAIALRRRPASLRALVWTVALGGLVLLPVFTALTPAWRVEVWPAPDAPAVAANAPLPAGAGRLAPRPATGDVRARGDVPADASLSVAAASTRVAPAGVAAAVANAPLDMTTTSISRARASLAPLAAAVLFGLVSLALLARIAISHVRMSRIIRRAEPADGDWAALAGEISRRMSIPRAVPVRITGAVAVPAVVGIVRPTLIVPADAAEWPTDMRKAVVLHELAHVARRDMLSQLICQVACALYWCLPLAWYGARRAAALRERASDDHVLRAGVRASAYAESLIGLARLARGGDFQAAALSMARPSRMRERVVAILDPSVRRDAPARVTVSALLLASCAAIAALAAVQPVQAAPPVPSVTARHVPAFESTALPATVLQAQSASAATVVTMASGASTASGVSAPPSSASTPGSTAAPTSAPLSGDRQSSAGPCAGRDLDSSSISNSDDDGKRTWKVTLKGAGCTVELRAEGTFEFNDDFTDIARVSRGGFFRLDVTEGGTRRQLEIEDNGTRTWRVNGREQAFDAAARAWLAGFLIEMDRRTAVGVDVRLPALLRQGGVNAVLNETGQMSGDYARSVYYKRLAKAATLSPADVTRILTQAAGLTKSDYYALEVIKAFADRGPANEAERAAITKLIDGMDSDYYRAESVKRLVGAGPIDAGGMDFLIRMIGNMKSDYYQHSVVTTAVRGGKLSPAHQARITEAATKIDSDYYAAGVLKEVAGSGTLSPEVRRSYFVGVSGIESDHYRMEALRELLEHGELGEDDLLKVVSAADGMSDHYATETLRDVLRHRAATDRVRSAVTAAAEHMSRHYRETLQRAVDRG